MSLGKGMTTQTVIERGGNVVVNCTSDTLSCDEWRLVMSKPTSHDPDLCDMFARYIHEKIWQQFAKPEEEEGAKELAERAIECLSSGRDVEFEYSEEGYPTRFPMNRPKISRIIQTLFTVPIVSQRSEAYFKKDALAYVTDHVWYLDRRRANFGRAPQYTNEGFALRILKEAPSSFQGQKVRINKVDDDRRPDPAAIVVETLHRVLGKDGVRLLKTMDDDQLCKIERCMPNFASAFFTAESREAQAFVRRLVAEYTEARWASFLGLMGQVNDKLFPEIPKGDTKILIVRNHPAWLLKIWEGMEAGKAAETISEECRLLQRSLEHTDVARIPAIPGVPMDLKSEKGGGEGPASPKVRKPSPSSDSHHSAFVPSRKIMSTGATSITRISPSADSERGCVSPFRRRRITEGGFSTSRPSTPFPLDEDAALPPKIPAKVAPAIGELPV